ncbi:unnamed protein product [Larinioides sclopetarius]|uniref:Uncharacterized protein n=1 Tax=Larinioides sclopetarius TaxID=280406 RepID=A0AAV2B6I7_9ARAC
MRSLDTIEHCRKKHVFKFRNDIDIKFKRIEVEVINRNHTAKKIQL